MTATVKPYDFKDFMVQMGLSHTSTDLAKQAGLEASRMGVAIDPYKICGDGERTEHLSKLCGFWLAKGFDLAETTGLMRRWNKKNTPPLSDSKVIDTCTSIYTTDQRNHPERHQDDQNLPLFRLEDARIERFIDHPAPPKRWLLKDWLPYGKVGMVVASGGTGKSMLALQLGISVATGLPLADHWEVGEQGSVMLLMSEDDDEEIHRRLENAAFQLLGARSDLYTLLKERLFIRSMVSMNNLITESDFKGVKSTNYVERLLEVLKPIQNLKLIVLDPVSRYRGGNENDSQDTTRFVEQIERLCQTTGASVLLLHHANKFSGSESRQDQGAARGSSALTDGVRWQMNLMPISGKELSELGISKGIEEKRYLAAAITKTNYGPYGERVVLRRGEGGLLYSARSSGKRIDLPLESQIKVIFFIHDKAGKVLSANGLEKKYAGQNKLLKVGIGVVREKIKEMLNKQKLVKEGRNIKVNSFDTALLEIDHAFCSRVCLD